MEKEKIIIANAQPHQASDIASLIMLAMNHDCCRYFAGPNHTLNDFHQLMTRLVQRNDSQYSFLHTLVALDDNQVIGCCVSYEGGRLRALRQAFIDEALNSFGIDYSGMNDETQAGELYVDSLAVDARYQGQGIATALLNATCKKAEALGLPVGLLVDKGNPDAERLYHRLGFHYIDDGEWGSHPMKHLQKKIQ